MRLKIKKNDLENLLNQFSWNYREIFIESSLRTSLKLINWVIESTSVAEESGFSVLSRTWEDKYFKAYSQLKNFKKEIKIFSQTFWLNKDFKKTKLDWDDFLVLKNRNTSKDIKKMASYLKFCKEILDKEGLKKDFIVSYNVYFLLSDRNYIVANTKNKFIQDSQYYNSFYVILTWKKWDLSEEIMEKITWTEIIADINKKNVTNTLKKAIKKLRLTLNWLSSPSWIMDVVIWNEAWWTIIHEAVWHWLEADLQNASVYKWKLWQKVASDNVNIVDSPIINCKRWSYVFDHEWTKTSKTYLIKDWILVSYLHNNSTAEIFNTESTWHWRRESYKYSNLVRMWITYLEPWKDKKDELISKIKSWIYVAAMWWWQVNEVTWDFVFQITSWFEIKDWKLWKTIRGATLSWNWPEMLNNIEWICDDLEYFDGWTCWKWQSMPVSDATPTIHVKLKVTGKS